MHHTRKWLTMLLAATVLGALVVAACATPGAVVTKLDLCLSLTGSYCDRSVQLGCPGADKCKETNDAECRTLFDGTCSALLEMGEKIDHDIENIIDTKDTCDGLAGIDGYLEGTIEELKNSGCEVSGEDDSY